MYWVSGNCLAAIALGEILADFSERESQWENPEKPSGFSKGIPQGFPDHRQDIKGTWWMPWHQESMKGVNGCEKPR